MSLYFDCAINSGGGAGNIHVSATWHSTQVSCFNLFWLRIDRWTLFRHFLQLGLIQRKREGKKNDRDDLYIDLFRYVTVYTDDGEPTEGIDIPAHPTAQVFFLHILPEQAFY